MDKVSLKKVIKPVIKECLKEILFEEGIIKIVQESIQNSRPILSSKGLENNYSSKEREFIKKNTERPKTSLEEAKKKLLQEVAMSGFDPFAGSEPIPQDSSNQFHEENTQESRLMAGIQGAGIDISRLMNANKKSWNFFNNALNKGKKE